MIDIDKVKEINSLIEKRENLEAVLHQVSASLNKNNTKLSEISSAFRFESEDELQIFANSIVDIVNQRLEKIEDGLDLFNITKDAK
jgi:hypothetical protein